MVKVGVRVALIAVACVLFPTIFVFVVDDRRKKKEYLLVISANNKHMEIMLNPTMVPFNLYLLTIEKTLRYLILIR